MDGWMDGWMDGREGEKANLRIANSNQNKYYVYLSDIFQFCFEFYGVHL